MIRLIAGILAIYGGFSVVAALQVENWIAASSGVLCLIAAVALWLKKTWSQYLVYLIGILFAGSWFWVIWKVWEQGWPYSGLLESAISLIPGLLMVSVAVGSMVVVHREFRRKR